MQLVRQPNVLSRRQVGEESEILIDDLDACLDPFDWRATGPVGALDEELRPSSMRRRQKSLAIISALHAGDDPDER